MEGFYLLKLSSGKGLRLNFCHVVRMPSGQGGRGWPVVLSSVPSSELLPPLRDVVSPDVLSFCSELGMFIRNCQV